MRPSFIYRFLLAAFMACLPTFARAQANMDTTGPAGLPSWVTSVGARTQPTATQEFKVGDFGAVGNGTTLCTTAIQAAINAANAAGGGIVTFAPGSYLSGALYLKSNVHLRIDKGVTLLGSQNIADFPFILTRVEGTDIQWAPGFLNIKDASNVLIDGGGLVDTQGEVWWNKWQAMYDGTSDPHGVQINGHSYATDLTWALAIDCPRIRVIVSSNATDLTLRDFNIRRSGFWTIQLTYSQYLTVDGLNIYDNTGPSTDGINLDSSSWGLIQNNTINNNDDGITMKSGRGFDGKRVNRPTEYVVIRNNATINSHGCISFGSEMTGGVRNVVVYNNYGSNSTREGIRVKSSPIRGGVIENILFQDSTFNNIRNPFYFDLDWATTAPFIPSDLTSYPSYWTLVATPITPASDAIPTFRNITVKNTHAVAARTIFTGNGLSSSLIANVLIDGVQAWGQNIGSVARCSNWTFQDVRLSLTGTTSLGASGSSGISFSSLPLADTDGDGSLDHWETTNGGSASSAATIARPEGPGITVAPFKNTAASGISSAKTYTHAISGGAAVTINGVPFSALTTSSTPGNFIWSAFGGTKGQSTASTLGTWAPASGGLSTTADAALIDLLGTSTFTTGVVVGDYQSYILTGLTPGQWYEFRLYLRGNSSSALRAVNLTFTNGWEIVRPFNAMPEDRSDLVLANGKPHSAYYLAYRYQAQENRLTLRAATANGQTSSFVFYGLTNEVAQADTDRDGLSDSLETNTGTFAGPAAPGTHATFADTDGDGEPDGLEVAWGTNPLDPASNRQPKTTRVITAVSELNGAAGGVSATYANGAYFGEDAVAFTDRTHQWNGATTAGLPAYLVGQEYVRTANEARAITNYQLNVTLGKSGKLYLLLDDRAAKPAWMTDGVGLDFTDTGDNVGWDKNAGATGPGLSIENVASVYVASDTANGNTTTLAAGTYTFYQRGGTGNNMYGVVAASTGSAPTTLDFDLDGIPDAVETANGLDPDWFDGPLDADGDGLSNLAEYLALTGINNPDTDGDTHGDGLETALGADPLSSSSVPPPPVCRSFAIYGGEAELEFFGLDPLRTYRLERSHDLADWTVRRTGLRPVEFGLFLLEPLPASERVFYVLRQE